MLHLSLRSKVLIGIALAIGGYVAFGPAGTETVELAKEARAPAQATHAATAAPRAQRAFYELAGRVADAASSAALFATHSWYTPPPPPPPPARVALSTAPVVPTAPPFPFAYMGSYTPDGASPVFFLTRDDRVFDVKAGDTLEGIYQVEGLRAGQLVVTYKPLNIQQTLAVEGTQ